MCYLKNLPTQEQFDFDDLFAKGEESSTPSQQPDSNVLIPCCEKQLCAEWSFEQQQLINLFDMIDKNNQIISALGKVFFHLHRLWTKILNKLEKVPFKRKDHRVHSLQKDSSMLLPPPQCWMNSYLLKITFSGLTIINILSN